MKKINFEGLKKFVAEARRNTYAGEGKSVEDLNLTGSKQLEYRKGDYFYRDIYFAGKDNFVGQEVVYFKDSPIWSMVYCGSAEPQEVISFLKKSLLTLSERCRFGGVCEFEENDFRYEDKGEGTMRRFSGKERIFKKGDNIYELDYHGGLIVK